MSSVVADPDRRHVLDITGRRSSLLRLTRGLEVGFHNYGPAFGEFFPALFRLEPPGESRGHVLGDGLDETFNDEALARRLTRRFVDHNSNWLPLHVLTSQVLVEPVTGTS